MVMAGQSSDTETNELVPAKTGEDYISLDEYFATLHEGETSVINPVYNKFFNVIQNTDSCKLQRKFNKRKHCICKWLDNQSCINR